MKLRFSIRDLLWLTALCAVLVAWWLDHRFGSHYLSRYTVIRIDSANGEPTIIKDNVTGKHLVVGFNGAWHESDVEPISMPGWEYVR